MKNFLALGFALISLSSLGQISYKPETNKKGEFFAHWGWNREWYTKSDIHFTGKDYDFTLSNVIAKDRQSKLEADPYLRIEKVTIPQYNFRVGYYVTPKMYVSLGADHMKYVVKQGQTVTINGTINEQNNAYNGSYSDDNIIVQSGFLEMEHTDGLNYLNVEVGRFDNVLSYRRMILGITEAVGVGAMYPRSDVHLFDKERHDEFHVAGFGANMQLGVNIKFRNHFYIQSEFRGGYVNLPDIRTTYDKADNAKQQFFYGQVNILAGAFWHLNNK